MDTLITSSTFLSAVPKTHSSFLYSLHDSTDLFSLEDLTDPLMPDNFDSHIYTPVKSSQYPNTSPLPDKIETASETPQLATLDAAAGSEAEPVEPSVPNELDECLYGVYNTPSEESDWAARDCPFLTAEYAGTEYSVFQSFVGSDAESEDRQSLNNVLLVGEEELFYAPLNGFMSAIKSALKIGDDRDVYMEIPQLELCFVEGRDDHNGMSLDYMTIMIHSLGRYSSDDGLDYHHLRIRIWDLPQHNRQLRHLEGLMAQVGIDMCGIDVDTQETKTEVPNESHVDEDTESIVPSDELSCQKRGTLAVDGDAEPTTCHLSKEQDEAWEEKENSLAPLQSCIALPEEEDSDLIPYDENDDIDADIRLLHSPLSIPVPTTLPDLTDKQPSANLGGQSNESDLSLGVPKAEISELAEVTTGSCDPLTSGIRTMRNGSEERIGEPCNVKTSKRDQSPYESVEDDITELRPGKRLRA